MLARGGVRRNKQHVESAADLRRHLDAQFERCAAQVQVCFGQRGAGIGADEQLAFGIDAREQAPAKEQAAAVVVDGVVHADTHRETRRPFGSGGAGQLHDDRHFRGGGGVFQRAGKMVQGHGLAARGVGGHYAPVGDAPVLPGIRPDLGRDEPAVRQVGDIDNGFGGGHGAGEGQHGAEEGKPSHGDFLSALITGIQRRNSL